MVKVINLFSLSSVQSLNKLDRLTVTSISCLGYCLLIKRKPTRVEHLMVPHCGVKLLAREPFLMGRLSTVGLLLLTSFDDLLFTLKILFIFFYKTSYLNEEIYCTEPSPPVSFPCTRKY